MTDDEKRIAIPAAPGTDGFVIHDGTLSLGSPKDSPEAREVAARYVYLLPVIGWYGWPSGGEMDPIFPAVSPQDSIWTWLIRTPDGKFVGPQIGFDEATQLTEEQARKYMIDELISRASE